MSSESKADRRPPAPIEAARESRAPVLRRSANPDTIRRQNLSAVLTDLHFHGPGSRTDLTRRTTMERSTIGNLVRELEQLGLVVTRPGEPAGRGRPSPSVYPSRNHVALGVRVVEGELSVAAVRLGGEVVESISVPFDVAELGPGETADEIVRASSAILDRLGPESRVVGTGVAVAGLVRHPDGEVRLAPNLRWENVPFGSMLATRPELLGRVEVSHAGNLGALAEQLRGAAVGVKDMVYVFGRFGVGGGVIAGGQRLDGSLGFAAEFGHMVVNGGGDPCSCGSRGCLETEAGGRALLRNAGVPLDAGVAGVERLLAAARGGEDAALSAVNRAAGWLGIGLASLVNIFNPTLIVLSGLYSEVFELAGSAMTAEMEGRALVASRSGVRVVRSDLGATAPLLGAAELAWSRVLADPVAITTQPNLARMPA